MKIRDYPFLLFFLPVFLILFIWVKCHKTVKTDPIVELEPSDNKDFTFTLPLPMNAVMGNYFRFIPQRETDNYLVQYLRPVRFADNFNFPNFSTYWHLPWYGDLDSVIKPPYRNERLPVNRAWDPDTQLPDTQ